MVSTRSSTLRMRCSLPSCTTPAHPWFIAMTPIMMPSTELPGRSRSRARSQTAGADDAVHLRSIWSTQVNEQQQPEEVPLEVVVQFTHYIRFVSVDPTKNRNRFYLLSWQPML